ncbi:MAG: Mrp/NBP35 family ATP-binding protein, partial [Planctomycetaceae bacterium]
MNQSQVTDPALMAMLSGVIDPEIGRTLGELNMLKGAAVTGNSSVLIDVELPTPAYPRRERITEALQAALAATMPQAKDVRVNFSAVVKGKNAGGKIGLKVHNIIAVGSGKGGVGKSTVAACLAYGLKMYGARVGLMDADVYGPSIPHMMGVGAAKPAAIQVTSPTGQTVQRIEPIEAGGVKMISMGFFVEPEKAVVWRGPMLHRAITQFLQETDWGELDYLIIDMPPGTGDVSLTLSQSVGLAGAVIVCTPQQVALLDAVKAISMFRQVNIPVLGIVENMSGDIFGRGGAKKKAEEMGIPFLGEIPIEAAIRIKGDEGDIAGLFAAESPSRPHLRHVCEQTAIEIARQTLESPSMPSLE